MPERFDAGTIGKIERTPQGGLRVYATPTRTGVFDYLRADGSIRREYRSPEEVFDPASLATLRGAPITDLHPEVNGVGVAVDPTNYRTFSVGHVADNVDRAGDHVAAWFVIQDATEIARIEAREREETSCGYSCALEETPGISPQGEKYDAIQRQIVYNHVALGPRDWGRAGPTARLHLDSAAQTIGSEMEKETIDGKEYTVGTADWRAAKNAYAAKLQARADKAEKELAEAKKLAEAKTDEKAQREAIKTKIKLVSDCEKLAAKNGTRFDADAALDAPTGDVMTEAIKMVVPNFDPAGKDPSYIEGYFAATMHFSLAGKSLAPESTDANPEARDIVADPEKKTDNANKKRSIFSVRAGTETTSHVDSGPDPDKAEAERRKRHANAWKTGAK